MLREGRSDAEISSAIGALWSVRGQCAMEMEFPADTSLTNVGFYGAQTTRKTSGKKITVTAEGAVNYIVSPVAATRVTAGRRTFDAKPAGTQVVHGMEFAEQWQLDPSDQAITTPTRRPGKFELREVNDSERGRCLELELKREGTVPAIVGEYTALRLKEPVPIPGKPHSVGMWVRGDSSWGRVFWEITDAKGERWRSNGGYDGGDWGSQSSMDFDG